LDLGARAFKVSVVKQHLQPPHNLLFAAAHERHDLTGTEKTMPVNEPDDVAVALRQLDGRDRGNAFETGESWHPARMEGIEKMGETAEVAIGGKCLNVRPTKPLAEGQNRSGSLSPLSAT